MKINATWHKEHRMPKKPTERIRLEWHRDHARNCSCRPLSEKLKNQIKEAGL